MAHVVKSKKFTKKRRKKGNTYAIQLGGDKQYLLYFSTHAGGAVFPQDRRAAGLHLPGSHGGRDPAEPRPSGPGSEGGAF